MELRDMDMDTPRDPEHRFGGGLRPDLHKRSVILKLTGVILLIIALVVFFGGRGDKNAAKELDAVKSHLDGLKNDLARIGIAEQKISSSERQLMELNASVASLQMKTESMKRNMEKLAQPALPNPQSPLAAPRKKPNSVEKRSHEVRRGETLFSIAKKYGTTSTELRRLNHLTKNSIQPGQRLIVDPGKSL